MKPNLHIGLVVTEKDRKRLDKLRAKTEAPSLNTLIKGLVSLGMDAFDHADILAAAERVRKGDM